MLASEIEALVAARDLRQLRATQHQLREREKELACLHNTCELLARDLPVDEALQAVADELHRAVQYPAEIFAEVVVEGRSFVAGLRGEIGASLETDLRVVGERVGRVGVYQRRVASGEEREREASVGGRSLGFFLVEEREMLDALAHRVGAWLDQSRTASALRASEARARAVFNALPLATGVWRACGSDDLELVELNETTRRTFGIEAVSLVGARASDLLAANPETEALLLRCLRSHQPQRSEINLLKHPDAEPRQFALHCAFVEPDLVVSYAEDVSEQRRVERQLWQAQKMEAVGQLAGGVAHDLNNLLAVIRCSSELVLATLDEDAPARDDVDEILVAGERAAELIRKLLAFGRRQVLEPVLLDLDGIVSDTSTMIARLLGQRVELELEASPVPLTVRADAGQLEQVLFNLALNANDAMPSGGQLRMATRSVDPDEASELGLQPGAWAELVCQDTGCGMDEATRQRIFEPFFTTKELGRGTGLGMASVYGIVTQSGGQILVDSEPGKGTQIRVYLPRVAQAGVRRPPSNPPVCEQGCGRVVLAEDDEAVRRLVARMLESAGYQVVAVATGAEALARFEAESDGFDLLVTDVVMPGMSGQALGEAVRRRWPGLPILYMSGYSSERLHIEARPEVHVRFIAKPFTGTQLTRAVAELIAPTTAAECA